MNQVHKLLALARSRNGLIVIVGVLLVLNVGRLVQGKYNEVARGVESKNALLGQYQIATQNIDLLRTRIRQLEARRQQFERHLFTGDAKEDVFSAMQIKLQEIVTASGVSPESLRPMAKSDKNDDKLYGEAIVKLRLTGKLEEFLKFLSALYKMQYLFKVENFTLKPDRKAGLKIFIDLKGFYRLTAPDSSEKGEG